jgi:hypothetical protein
MGCGGSSIPTSSDGSPTPPADLATPAGDLAGGAGSWFYTCGDSVCGGHRITGVTACTATQQVGKPCAPLGSECDPISACDQLLLCATSDPTHGGMCPISRRKYKTDIHYLDAAERARVREQLLAIPLATWRYKDAPERARLGFILEDVEPSPGVDGARDQVDLYGYASMAVAALQEQARQIDELKREVAQLKRRLRRSP